MVFIEQKLSFDFAAYGYGTLGHSQKVLSKLYEQGWSKEFLSDFMYLSEKNLDEVEKNYTELIGLDCAKLEFLFHQAKTLAEAHQKPLQDVCAELMDNDPKTFRNSVITAILSQ